MKATSVGIFMKGHGAFYVLLDQANIKSVLMANDKTKQCLHHAITLLIDFNRLTLFN